jgi:hypothetical protein
MQRYAATVLLFLTLLLCQAQTALPFEGPLQVRNQLPLFMAAAAPMPERALLEDSLSAGFSYSSVFMARSSQRWSVSSDFEVAELAFQWKKRVGDYAEIGIHLPVLSYNSGFADGFLETYHKTFGFSDYGRSSRPKNAFLYEVRKDGRLLVKGEGGSVGLGDISLSAKVAVLRGDPCVSLLAAVELPTGDASRGFGNGSLDARAAVLIEKRFGERFLAFGNLGYAFPGDLKAIETEPLKGFPFGALGLEAALSPSFSVVGQVVAQGSPFGKTGIASLDRTSVLLSFGGRYRTGKNSIEVSLTEDPNTSGAPDVTVSAVLKHLF